MTIKNALLRAVVNSSSMTTMGFKSPAAVVAKKTKSKLEVPYQH